MIREGIGQGVGVIPWSPLARGLLAGNRTRGGERRTTRSSTDAFGDTLYSDADFDVVDRVAEVAAVRGGPTAHDALALLLLRTGLTAHIRCTTQLRPLV